MTKQSPTFLSPRYSHYLRKWIGFCLIIAGYFFLIRPLRVGFLSVLIPMIEPLVESSALIELRHSSTTIIATMYESLPMENPNLGPVYSLEYTYAPAFNMFFMMASLALWLLDDLRSSLLPLSIIHVTSWITATIFLYAGLTLHPNWWIGSDLITVYLLPLASMSLVAIRYAQQLTILSR
ncbi:hypothetical protein OAU86_03970 [Balneolaceae bacterium]|nr:hypothetical protein [Balneolaceae bacterium]